MAIYSYRVDKCAVKELVLQKKTAYEEYAEIYFAYYFGVPFI